MATYYAVNGNASIPDGAGGYIIVAGNNSNDGLTQLTPKKTFANVISTYTLTTSDTVNLAGIHVGAHTCVAAVQQWSGQGQYYIVGSVAPTDDSGLTWTQNVDTWSVTIGASKTLGTYDPDGGGALTSADHGNVCAKWLSRVDSYGRHYGWYKWGTLSTGRLTADKRVNYDRSTGILYIRDDTLFSGGVTPNTLTGMDAVRYVTGDTYQIGLDQRSASACPGATGGIIAHYCTRLNNSNSIDPCWGYAGGGNLAMLANMQIWDCEVHGVVFSNNPNTSTRASNVQVWGAGTTDGYNAMVWHNGGTGGTCDVTGARATGVTLNCYSLLDPDGVPHTSSVGINGFYAHTVDSIGGTIDDIEVTASTVTFYENPGNPTNAANTNLTVSNVDVWTTYPIRFVDCIFKSIRTSLYIQGNIAFRRCFIDTTGCALQSSLAVATVIMPIGTGFKCLLESCVHVTNMDDPGAIGRELYYIMAGATLSRINTTTIDLSTGTANDKIFIYPTNSNLFVDGSAGFMIRSKGCIDYFKTASTHNYYSFNDNGGTVTANGNYSCSGNWLFNVAANKYGQNASWSSQANWQTNIDTNAVIDVDPLFVTDTSVSPTVAGIPSASSTVWTRRIPASTTHATSGYNRQLFGGQRGAYQRGGSLSKKLNLLLDRGRRRRARP